jgi:hypothetical protein
MADNADNPSGNPYDHFANKEDQFPARRHLPRGRIRGVANRHHQHRQVAPARLCHGRPAARAEPAQEWRLSAKTRTLPAVLVALLAFALSLLWTVAPQEEALGSLAKYGKLSSSS